MTSNLKNGLIVFSLIIGLVALAQGPLGCSQDKAGTSSAKPPEGQPMRAPDKMGGAPPPRTQQTASAQPSRKEPPPPVSKEPPPPRRTEPPSKFEPGPTAKIEPPPSPPPAPAPPAPAADSDEARRSQAEDMIYATIRIKMEEAITERAKLLKEGREPSDERIRQLEGTIMRARDLLTENGEVVEDVSPPIVQTQPK